MLLLSYSIVLWILRNRCYRIILKFTQIQGYKMIYLNNPVYETAKETLMYRTVLWTLWRGRGWEDLGEWHWNMYDIMYEMSCQSRFDARYWMLGAGALGRPRGMEWGGRRVQDGQHMYTCGGFILIFGKTNTIM